MLATPAVDKGLSVTQDTLSLCVEAYNFCLPGNRLDMAIHLIIAGDRFVDILGQKCQLEPN